MSRLDNKVRREERRAAVAAERAKAQAEREARAKNRGGLFTAKVRRGDALQITLDFRGGEVVPFTDENDPSKGVREQVELLKTQRERAEKDPPS